MKRDHQNQQDRGRGGGGGGGEIRKEKAKLDECSSSFTMSTSKPHPSICKKEEQDHNLGCGGGGMDELLEVLGYKVRNSDMDDVAQKLEQLEMVMGSRAEDGVISHLSDDTVYYNPSDLSSWLQSMLSEFNTCFPPPDSTASTITTNTTTLDFASSSSSSSQFPDPTTTRSHMTPDLFDGDLRAIPGAAACAATPPPVPPPPPQTSSREDETDHAPKRFRSSNGDAISTSSRNISNNNNNSNSNNPESTRPVVLVDSQEAGVRLVHTLMACAEATQQENLKLADELVKHVNLLAASQAGAMKKVATYFAVALARRIYQIYPQDALHTDILQMHFYESCPYLKFAHFTANQAILEAFATTTRVHVIDFGLKQGIQWPALMQALALRPGGPPAFRLTGIGPPQPDNTDALRQVGWKLAQLAETIGVEFEFRGFVANSLADLEPSMLDLRPTETVAVNSVFELHSLLARPGAIDKVMNSIKAMRPKIVTLVEQEANHNGPVFLDRFTEALHYYSCLFDSLEGSGSEQDVVMSEMYLGRQICNLVACEGVERVERHERLENWRTRMGSAGFEAVHLGSNAFKQASMLLALFAGGDGYRVEENNGCLMLGWHTRPLIATSAWQLPEAASPTSDVTQ